MDRLLGGGDLNQNDINRFLSPSIEVSKSNPKEILSALKQRGVVKFNRVRHFFQTKGEWINNEAVHNAISRKVKHLKDDMLMTKEKIISGAGRPEDYQFIISSIKTHEVLKGIFKNLEDSGYRGLLSQDLDEIERIPGQLENFISRESAIKKVISSATPPTPREIKSAKDACFEHLIDRKTQYNSEFKEINHAYKPLSQFKQSDKEFDSKYNLTADGGENLGLQATTLLTKIDTDFSFLKIETMSLDSINSLNNEISDLIKKLEDAQSPLENLEEQDLDHEAEVNDQQFEPTFANDDPLIKLLKKIKTELSTTSERLLVINEALVNQPPPTTTKEQYEREINNLLTSASSKQQAVLSDTYDNSLFAYNTASTELGLANIKLKEMERDGHDVADLKLALQNASKIHDMFPLRLTHQSILNTKQLLVKQHSPDMLSEIKEKNRENEARIQKIERDSANLYLEEIAALRKEIQEIETAIKYLDKLTLPVMMNSAELAKNKREAISAFKQAIQSIEAHTNTGTNLIERISQLPVDNSLTKDQLLALLAEINAAKDAVMHEANPLQLQNNPLPDLFDRWEQNILNLVLNEEIQSWQNLDQARPLEVRVPAPPVAPEPAVQQQAPQNQQPPQQQPQPRQST